MKKTIANLLLASSTLLVGCLKEIDINTFSVEKKVVIEGNISNDKSSVLVKVSWTGEVTKTSDFLMNNDAKVKVIVDGTTHNIPFKGDGIYSSNNIIPEVGKEYKLIVEVGKETYTAKTVFPAAVNSTLVSSGLTEYSTHRQKIALTFPAGDSYVRFQSSVNRIYLSEREFDLGSYQDHNTGDTLHMHEYILKEPELGSYDYTNYLPGDTFFTTIHTLDKATHNYFFQMNEAIYQADVPSLISTPPYNPVNNFDQTEVYGYFGAYQVTEIIEVFQ